MWGRIKGAAKMAVKLKGAQRAFVEVRDVIAEVKIISNEYELAKKDGKISAKEADHLLQRLGKLAREGIEARDELAKLF
jgi:major membrane immunogen (membrane-anchored lipoprotein)